MKYDDETLMAYADGELDAPRTVELEAAIRDDPTMVARVAAHPKLRAQLRDAFADDIAEPVPQRLLSAARGAPPAIASLEDARVRAQRATPPTVAAERLDHALTTTLAEGSTGLVTIGVSVRNLERSAPPDAVIAARADGDVLDHAGELAARARGWQ